MKQKNISEITSLVTKINNNNKKIEQARKKTKLLFIGWLVGSVSDDEYVKAEMVLKKLRKENDLLNRCIEISTEQYKPKVYKK